MFGSPVWLASISRKSPITGGRLSTQVWSPQTMQESIDLLRRVLGPAGNPDRERIFRMQVTLCLHRALTKEEVAALPPAFHEAEATDLAGGPVEIIWENEEGAPSTRPCANPRRYPLDPKNKLLWFPLDCGACPSCKARAKLDADGDRTGRAPLYLDDMLSRATEGRR
jgi:hypothetical protein